MSEGFNEKSSEFLRRVVKNRGISKGLNGKMPEFLRALEKIVISEGQGLNFFLRGFISMDLIHRGGGV